jgi:hypothetical protein
LQRRRHLDLVGGRIPTKVADDAQHETSPIPTRHRVNRSRGDLRGPCN